MSKAVLISIKPEWVEKILNGKKIIEIRKTMPKCELPCKVYIYCTKDPKNTIAPFCFADGWHYKIYNDKTSYANGCMANIGEDINGKVVAEFILNKIDILHICDPYVIVNDIQASWDYFEKHGLLTYEQAMDYLGGGYDNGWDYECGKGYAWHIDNLKIYDRPKELSEFTLPECEKSECACENCKYLEVINTPYAYETNCVKPRKLTKAPQSWYYVEELGEK